MLVVTGRLQEPDDWIRATTRSAVFVCPAFCGKIADRSVSNFDHRVTQ
jgi:hypothetical protein